MGEDTREGEQENNRETATIGNGRIGDCGQSAGADGAGCDVDGRSQQNLPNFLNSPVVEILHMPHPTIYALQCKVDSGVNL